MKRLSGQSTSLFLTFAILINTTSALAHRCTQLEKARDSLNLSIKRISDKIELINQGTTSLIQASIEYNDIKGATTEAEKTLKKANAHYFNIELALELLNQTEIDSAQINSLATPLLASIDRALEGSESTHKLAINLLDIIVEGSDVTLTPMLTKLAKKTLKLLKNDLKSNKDVSEISHSVVESIMTLKGDNYFVERTTILSDLKNFATQAKNAARSSQHSVLKWRRQEQLAKKRWDKVQSLSSLLDNEFNRLSKNRLERTKYCSKGLLDGGGSMSIPSFNLNFHL